MTVTFDEARIKNLKLVSGESILGYINMASTPQYYVIENPLVIEHGYNPVTGGRVYSLVPYYGLGDNSAVCIDVEKVMSIAEANAEGKSNYMQALHMEELIDEDAVEKIIKPQLVWTNPNTPRASNAPKPNLTVVGNEPEIDDPYAQLLSILSHYTGELSHDID